MKTFLVTGGSSGIGLALVKKLCSEGHSVINIDINPLNEFLSHVTTYLVDVSDKKSLEQCFFKIDEVHSSIDGVACVAGVGYSTSVDDVDVETFDQQVKTNLHQVYYVIKNILGIRKTLNSIVTVSSVSSFGGSGSSVSYGAAKAGVIGLTKNLAYELAIHNVRVNTVIPGAIATPLFLKLTTSTERRLLENVTPSRRLGTPEDVASVIFFLLSSESNHITGQCITVDGGLSLAYKPYLT